MLLCHIETTYHPPSHACSQRVRSAAAASQVPGFSMLLQVCTVASIYQGNITLWSHPRILGDNG
jgi:hypothetical protein